MNAQTIFSLLTIFCFAGRAAADGVDKAKLRELAELPKVGVVVGVSFSSTFGVVFNGDKPDPLAEIARLQKQMKGDAGDVERYLRLGQLQAKVKCEKESDQSYAKAVAICREQVRKHPDDMSWLARLGDALIRIGEDKEAKPLLRRAVKEAPNEWRAWLALAECVDLLALRAAFGDKHFSLCSFDEKVVIPTLSERKPTAKQLAKMRRLWKEARRCHDRACTLAPRRTKPYLRRITSNQFHGAVELGLREKTLEKINLATALFTPEIAADISRIARLTPDDPKILGPAAIVEIMACIFHDKIDAKGHSLLESLPAESGESVSWDVERLAQLTENRDKGTAAAASEILADVLMMIKRIDEVRDGPSMGGMGGFSGIAGRFSGELSPSTPESKAARIRGHLYRAVRFDPSRDRAWDLLTGLLVEEKKFADALSVARKRIAVKDNAHNRFLLAKIQAESGQFDKATEGLHAGLKGDSKDMNCRLGLIAVLLKRDNAQALKEAGEQLDAVEARMKENKSKNRYRNYLMLRGIHAALSNRPSRAKECFREILHGGSKGNKMAAKAVAALGEPLGPMDETLAVDYVRAWEGKVELADERPDSPVVKVRLDDRKFTDKDLIFLSAFPQLHDLDLSFTSITDAGLAPLRSLGKLRELNLQCTKITGKGLDHLKSLTKLRSLQLEGAKITDADLAHLASLPALEELWIGGRFIEGNLTGAGLVHLRKLTQLRALHLSTPITDKGMAHVAALRRLRILDVNGRSITDEGMRHFERLAELRELDIGGAKITDAGLSHLKELRHLHVLCLAHAKITDEGLIHLKDLSRLEELDLSDTSITDAGLAHLSGLTNLRILDLSSCKHSSFGLLMAPPHQEDAPTKKPDPSRITDAGLKHLQKLSQMQSLDLRGQSITDAGLTQLADLKKLSELYVNSGKVTEQGIAELRKALPKLHVHHPEL